MSLENINKRVQKKSKNLFGGRDSVSRSFEEAFSKARKQKKKEFTWRGNTYKAKLDTEAIAAVEKLSGSTGETFNKALRQIRVDHGIPNKNKKKSK